MKERKIERDKDSSSIHPLFVSRTGSTCPQPSNLHCSALRPGAVAAAINTARHPALLTHKQNLLYTHIRTQTLNLIKQTHTYLYTHSSISCVHTHTHTPLHPLILFMRDNGARIGGGVAVRVCRGQGGHFTVSKMVLC